ncbi:hypothetical protein HK097_003295 [Rhizophlyctis rosea]|uniref:Uncharacterized protein n=1 Tax=Rhizophlyctis rosea TaxID=64517 RepID=A0AAD5SIA8_9FUNG|nr:hypothetical protein HK097_003295 [Rhizophlyctis rosea]
MHRHGRRRRRSERSETPELPDEVVADKLQVEEAIRASMLPEEKATGSTCVPRPNSKKPRKTLTWYVCMEYDQFGGIL